MISLLIMVMAVLTAGYVGASVASRRGREGSNDEPALRELRERMDRLEQSLESATAELERMGESQRFLTALLEDRAKSQPALKRPGDESER